MISNECTDKVQSERIINIGINKNTADHITLVGFGTTQSVQLRDGELYEEARQNYSCDSYPSWSIAQLLYQLPLKIKLHDKIADLVIKPEENLLTVYYITKDNEILAKRTALWKVTEIINLLVLFREGELE